MLCCFSTPLINPFFLVFSCKVLNSLTEVDRAVRASSTEYIWICYCSSALGQVESGAFSAFGDLAAESHGVLERVHGHSERCLERYPALLWERSRKIKFWSQSSWRWILSDGNLAAQGCDGGNAIFGDSYQLINKAFMFCQRKSYILIKGKLFFPCLPSNVVMVNSLKPMLCIHFSSLIGRCWWWGRVRKSG